MKTFNLPYQNVDIMVVEKNENIQYIIINPIGL